MDGWLNVLYLAPPHLSKNKGICTLAKRIASYSSSQSIDQYTCWAKSRKSCSNLLLVVVLVLLLLFLVAENDDDDDDDGTSRGDC